MHFAVAAQLVAMMSVVLTGDKRRALIMRGARAITFAFFVFLHAAVFGGVATAQDFLGPTHALPEYAAPGIQQGDFLINQAVSFGLAYDSNILQSHSHGIQDFIFFVSPAVDITHNAVDHVDELLVSATNATYFKSENDDYTDVYVRASETYFLSPTDQIAINASLADGYQRRTVTNFEAVGNPSGPIHEMLQLGSLSYKHTGSIYEAGVAVTASAEQLDNMLSTTGTLLDESIYNQNDLALDSFFRIELSSRVKSELIFQAANFDYKDKFLSYEQWRAGDAITVDLTSKTNIRLFAGMKEQYLTNIPGATTGLLAEYEAQANWSPTQLLSLFAKTGYHDLGLDYLNGIGNGVFNSGGYGTYYSFGGSYMIWRNLQFTTSFAVEKRYIGGNQDVQDDLTYKAALTYEFNSYAGISLLYDGVQWNSRFQQYNFNENIFQTSFNLRF